MRWSDFVGDMLQRSYGLVDALIDCVDSDNLVAAAPLLRLRLDTLVRASFVARSSVGVDVIKALFGGGEFRKMKDEEGRQVAESRLNELPHPHHPSGREVYRQTSGRVHPSENHLRSTWQFNDDDNFRGSVPLRPGVVPGSLSLELLTAMVRGTEELFLYVEGWAIQIAGPAEAI
jgi:hypothetical protein